MKKYTVYLTEVQINLLKKQSKKTGLTASEILRRVLDNNLQKKEINQMIENTCGKEVKC